MKTFICTVNTETEKNEWLARTPAQGTSGKQYKYIAEIVVNSNQWKIFVTDKK